MSFGLSVSGDLLEQVNKFKQVAEKEFKTAVKLTSIAVLGDSVKSIQRGSKTGRIYKKGGVFHQASAPGESPASDTGRLAGDIDIINKGLTATVGTALEYGRFLEHGTMRIAERPWLRPAIDKNRQLFIKRLTLAIRNASK